MHFCHQNTQLTKKSYDKLYEYLEEMEKEKKDPFKAENFKNERKNIVFLQEMRNSFATQKWSEKFQNIKHQWKSKSEI